MTDPSVRTVSRRPGPGRSLLTGLVLAYFLVGGAILAVRYLVLPNADLLRPHIVASASQALGLPVAIGRVEAEWDGLSPRLMLSAVTLKDAKGRDALTLSRVEAVLSWQSLRRGHVVFQRLVVVEPELDVRRELDGHLLVAGIGMDASQGDGSFGQWLAEQPEIVILDATVAWTDAARDVPPLVLDRANLRIIRSPEGHRFGLTASPPEAYASALELRGTLGGVADAAPGRLAGEVFVRLERADLSIWRNWVDYPVPLEGRGGATVWLKLDGSGRYSARADLALREARTRLRADLPELDLRSLEGTLLAERDGDSMAVELQNVRFDGLGGAAPLLNAHVRYRPQHAGQAGGGSLETGPLDIGMLARLAAHLPFEPAVLAQLSTHAPQGAVESLTYRWEGPEDDPTAWTLQAQVSGLTVQPTGAWPGLTAVSGHLEGNQSEGRFTLEGTEAELKLPEIFDESVIPLARVEVTGGWARDEGLLAIRLDRVALENADAAAVLEGRYWPSVGRLGRIDLSAEVSRADARAVWRYLPKVVGAETRAWLKSALLEGAGRNGRLELKGELTDFPFARPGSGRFLVEVDVSGGRLAFVPSWPEISAIEGRLRFEGKRMRIDARRAESAGAVIGRTVVEIPDLGSRDPAVRIRGQASGASSAFLQYLEDTPIAGWIGGATHDFRAVGDGVLSLSLVLPLARLAESSVEGEYAMVDNQVSLVPSLPSLAQVSARVGFTERGVSIHDAHGILMGQPVAAVAATDDRGRITIRAAGTATAAALAKETGLSVLERLEGLAGWTARVDFEGGTGSVRVRSDLAGVASSLPAPLAKAAEARLPLEIQLDLADHWQLQRWEVRLADDRRARFDVRRDGSGRWRDVRGGFAVDAPLREAEHGLMAAIRMDDLDLDAWRRLAGAGEGGPLLAGIALRAERLSLFGEVFERVDLRGVADAGGWRGRLESPAVAGEFDWRSRDEGALKARFDHLVLGSGAGEHANADQVAPEQLEALPALDVVAERFQLRGMALGQLTLRARNLDGEWQLDALELRRPTGAVVAEGHWQPGGGTELAFTADIADVGAYLSDIGYPEAVRQGRALLEGKLGWHGAPTQVHYPSLNGRMEVRVEEGQFSKLEPGMGRLLGVLSLQALPRRVTLDFRDVFSDGFAFDSITGGVDVSAGVMKSDGLDIRGPAARIRLTGTVDLASESQALRVAVQPTLTESVAVGAALANSATGLINPVAGLVTYLAQKLMQDPIERLFSYEYAVTGAWSDPEVAKLASDAPRAQ
ncbi:MAG: TIGR02099 family protein [Rhodocyclaceae bacterium]|nr:TIGR02099 family protein [Rhodocyclaceae bacterium]